MKDEKLTHIQVRSSDRDKLKEIRKKEGYASIEIVINKMLKKYGDKQL